jgi:ComF family protein
MLELLLNLLFPKTCVGCEKVLLTQEKILCINCLIDLPYFEQYESYSNTLEKTFWGRIKIEKAHAYLLFKKTGTVKNIIQEIKYYGNKKLAFEFGFRFGQKVSKQLQIAGINGIIAVPLHEKRLKKRGYNQSEFIVQGMCKASDIPNFSHLVKRKIYTNTQTSKSRIERWENVESIYEIDPEIFNINTDAYFLIVDDVITTGATIESLARSLQEAGKCKTSVAALAFAP